MTRYEAAKRRQQYRDEQACKTKVHNTDDSNLEIANCQSIAVQCDIISQSVEVQTDLTMADLAALEHECQQRLNEMHLLKEHANRKSYPVQESLKNDSRLLSFYTGLTNMTVFFAVFNFIIPQAVNSAL